jgi:hypothetical protein
MPKHRQIFFIDKDKPVTAGGVIFYKFTNSTMKILLIDSDRFIEDIGGTAEVKDKDIYDCVAREVEEETNNVFKKQNVLNRIKKSSYIYLPKSKYVVYFIKSTKKEELLKVVNFGKKEIHDNIERTIKWYDVKKVLKSAIIQRLNYRIRNVTIFKKLRDLRDEKFSCDE